MKLTPATIDLLDTAEWVFSLDVDLPADIDEVWSVLVDNTSWGDWFNDCKSMTASPSTWSAAGDTRTIHTGPFKIDEVAVELTEPTRWAMTLVSTNIPMAKTMLEVLDLTDTSRNGEDRTEIRWTGALNPPVYLKPFRGILESQLTAVWAPSLESLLDAVIARR